MSIYTDIKIEQVLAPAVLNGTATSASVTRHYNAEIVFSISTGAITDAGIYRTRLELSDDNITWFATEDYTREFIGQSLSQPMTANTVYVRGYKGLAPYVRLVLVKDSGGSIAIAVNALSKPGIRPVR